MTAPIFTATPSAVANSSTAVPVQPTATPIGMAFKLCML